MINEQYKQMLGGKSVIRQLSEFATARGKEIGYENVFDYSLGNPSVPVPDDYTKEMEHNGSMGENVYREADVGSIHLQCISCIVRRISGCVHVQYEE